MNSTRQLIDSLTAHLSLYNSNSKSPNPNANPNPRSSILKWFSSLSVHQRQAHLTSVDDKFTQILIQMLHKLESNGHCLFIVLPDIPNSLSSSEQRKCSATSNSRLPSLCFRKSRGLLSRVSELNESERLIRESTRLLSSKEGENIKKFSLLGNVSCIDSMTVTEEFVENVDRFVEIMDDVSSGQFLRGEESGGLGSEWVEMEWLKDKGYYSMEAFVANKFEVALRLAWLNCSNSGKKRGVKLKEKMNGAGIAANVFWRKRGCVDWWGKLDGEMKKNVLRMVVGRAAKCLAVETVKEKNILRDKVWMRSLRRNDIFMSQENSVSFQPPDSEVGCHMSDVSISGNPSSLHSVLSSLILLQDISSMLLACQDFEHDEGKIFFSSLDAVNTTRDCVLRKLRELLMMISLDCTKFELLGEGNGNPSTRKPKEKLDTNEHKKKGKNRNAKRSKPMARSSEDDPKLVKGTKGIGDRFFGSKNADASQTSRRADKIQEKDLCIEPLPPAVHMECSSGLNNGNIQNAPRRRRERKKLKSLSSQRLVEVESFQARKEKVPSVSINSGNEAPSSERIAQDSAVENAADTNATGNDKHEQSPKDCMSTSEGINIPILKNCKDTGMVEVTTEGPGVQVKRDMEPSATPIISSVSFNDDLDRSIRTINFKQRKEVDAKSSFLEKLGKDGVLGKRVVPIHKQGSIGLYDIGIVNSYEWPSVSPLQVPPCISHLPAATDRLHLDVGHNWQNHFHQSFVPTVHRMRNPPVENRCSGIVSRPLPMSLDWPPVVRGVNGLAPSVACNYDSGFISRRHSGYPQGFSSSSVQRSMAVSDDERVYANDFPDLSDLSNSQEVADEHENHWMSEEELELHAVSGMDYNQYFGGGVMYWNPSDYPGSSFSRPPSLSSEDSSWAWREADMNRAVDDMVAFSSSYSTNGLTSPSAAPFCSPFDPLGPGHQAVGYVLSEGEIGGKVLHSSSTTDAVTDENASGALSALSGDVEAKTGDSLPYPILRPIIIPNMSRERSRSDFRHSHEHKSPCVPHNSREQPRIKRPPSPVVLCVPRAPRPPPPSPVGNSRKHRGFPTVRSGSSSPRHWGVKGWSHDGINFEEACIRMDGSEVVWPSWRNKSLSACKLTQPVPGALLQDRLIAISQLARDQEHPDVAFPLQPPELLNSSNKASLSVIHSLLHDEIDSFCKLVAAENLTRKPYINWTVKRVTRSLQVLWPRSRTNVFGSNATGLSLPSSDVDLVVCLPPVRNLEPIKEAGILEGRNGIKETCLQHAARYLANQEWVKSDSLKIVENTAIPIIMLVVEVPHDLIASTASDVQTLKVESVQGDDPVGSERYVSEKYTKIKNSNGKDVNSVRLDISFKSPSHTGLQTTELVKELTEQFPAAKPLALVLKKFLADRSLDQSYSGGLSSYCLVLLIIRFLQHEHHLGRPINQNYGSLLMDFLYFFGNVFDPRQMRVSVQGSGTYINREQGYSIDPIYIDDPLFPTNNVGRNCFRIHQCVKAFADAYSTLENVLTSLPNNDDLNSGPTCKLLPKIIPSIGHVSEAS